ncbi:hypothetical protein NM688_g6168 [Phlebia brevispora]|uniref:Uncharacterized protein n=1 Tax=Phlebia brevispora TaxID=194682 RepID=A0ACC1SJ56_9APHY|nr:hypothetical protein NM688_g6168 [Phlebia brevispora]
MYPLGLLPLLQAWIPDYAAVKLSIALPGIILLALLWSLAENQEEDDTTPTALPLSGLSTIWPFFKSRFDFLARGFQLTGRSIFQFNLLQNTVVVVSGESGRNDFFSCRGLDINEGFKVLSGAIPMLPGITSDLQARRIALIHKRLAAAQNSDRLTRLLPQILGDAERVICSWGYPGTIDPFSHMPALLFQTTVRSLSCHEIADDAALVARLRKLYDRLDSSTTPASVLLPWFPSPSMLSKLYASKQVYDIVNGAINARVQSGVSRDDTLQMLVDHGDDKLVIVGFIMGLLVAGARSTGTTASWMTTCLGGHPEWKHKARAEVRALLSDCSAGNVASSSLKEQLAAIPLEAWEDHTPVLDKIIRETLRLAQPHTAMRRNVGPETYINGMRIPSGAYVVYPFSDVHLNSTLYPDPWRFDPDRSDRVAPYEYVGWGGGKTVCLGQRLAKLQLKLIAAMLLLKFDFILVDVNGRTPNPLPRPNWNDTLTCKPPIGSCYLQFQSISEGKIEKDGP